MRDVLSRMARANRPPFHTLTPVQARAAYEAGSNVLELPKQALPRVVDFGIPVRDGHVVAARLYAPSMQKLPVLLYFHGGGFTIGSINTHDGLCRQLSHLAGCAVMSVDYRLAPEHKFPVAAHDAWDTLEWLVGHAAELGLDGHQLAVGGDSAGGTLAAMCALLARDTGLPLELQLLFYPGCASHQETASHRRFAKGFVLDEADINWFFNHYLRSPADREDWRFAPLNASHMDDVAPAWFGLAECDPLVEEGLLYADRLRAASVPVDLEIYRGVTHEFIKMGRLLPEARLAHADAARALRHAFHLKPHHED
ncbi:MULTISPECIES: alpha/beta hydrolase [unclassified Polaromonas]|uniref:alpha/beta hydrolase n=1 Tax=unclassified Polaromonas TaxID=2638319 RepID=UPI001A1E039D|nr:MULTISPECIES: alpha/beta hydrolase [unclassified Polaromonas]MBG6073190.1 acetyl esterase [Polaromonas sp. CG_9.7]MBG6115194.1 acetyl esterase [Polaromonas sp. CG_9.2]MDH6185023.1 acetyl esterase [Polaromonas sp. CG_23.6]